MAGAPSRAAIIERQEKAAPELSALVNALTNEPLDALLPKLLEWSTLPWDRPRGDLCHWLPLLNRLDAEMKTIIANYDFKTSKPVVLAPEHEKSLLAMVQFAATLTENCANRAVYPSIPILGLLIETANIVVVSNTLFLLSKFLPRKGSNIATIEVLSQHINAKKLVRMCCLIPAQISSKYIELKDFYDLPPLYWAEGYTLVGGPNLGWPEDPSFIQNSDLHTLASNTCQNTPEILWEGLRYRIWLAKAFTGDASVRHHLIFTQCRSIAIAFYILQEAKFTAEILAIRPNTLTAIAKLVTSSHIAELRLLGVQIFHHIVIDRSSILSAEVRRTKSLGIVTVLSQATRAAKLGEPIAEEFLSRLFSFARDAMWVDLTAMGIIPLCLEFLTIDTPFLLKSKTACSSFLNTLVMEVQAANTAFIEVNGVESLIHILVREVDPTRVREALRVESPPTFCKVDHDLSLDRVRWICSAVVLLANLLTLRRSSTLFRKVLDSPLLDVCAELISNPAIFSGRNAALALDLVVALIKQDENTIQVLQEKNLMGKMLNDTMILFDSRFKQYPAGLAFYVALCGVCKSLSAPGNENILEKATSEAFDAIIDDMNNIPMFAFRQIGRATFSNAGAPKDELFVLIHQLLRVFARVKSKLTDSSAISPEVFTTDSDGTDWAPPGATVSSLDAIMHLAETSLEEPRVMSAFIKVKGHLRLLEVLAESPLPFDYSNRAAGKTRLVRLFKRIYQLSSDRPKFMGECVEYLLNITRTMVKHVKDAAPFPSSSGDVTLLWAASSFCFTIQLVSRILFINPRSAATVISFFRSGSGVAVSDLVRMLGEIHQWALEQSAKWVSLLGKDTEWATNPISARISSYMGPGVGLSGETTAADTEYVTKLFRALPSDTRSEAQAIKANRWLLARVHILCTEFMGYISMYATADSIYELDPKCALVASQNVSEVYRANLNRAMTWDMGLLGRYATVYFLIDLRSILLNDRKYLNLGAFVLFVQSGGLGDLVRLVNRLVCSHRDGSVASLYLAGGCKSVDFYDDSIVFALDRLSELVSSPEYMGNSLHNTEFCVRASGADEPEYFSMAQFLVELRIKILVDLKQALPLSSWSKLPALALESLQEIFEFVNLDIHSDDDEMALPGSDLERSNLPLLILPGVMFNWEEKVAALTSTGSISTEKAETALRENEGSVRLVCQTLDIPLPPENLFEREQVVGIPPELDGHQYKVIEDLHLLNNQWKDWIGEYLLRIVDNNNNSPFYATKLFSKVVRDWGELEGHELLRLLLSDVHSGSITPARLYFLATLTGIGWLCFHIRPQLAASINKLTELATGPNEHLIAPALTILEKVLVEDGSTAAVVSTWLETEASGFMQKLASAPSHDNVTEVVIARFLLLLSWRSASYDIPISLIDSGVLDRFLSIIQKLSGSVMGQQLQLVTILLLRSVVEPDDVQARVFQSSLLKVLMTESTRPEFDEIFNMFADIFARNPQLMVDVCSKETVYDQEADVLVPRLLYEKFVDHVNQHILKKGYDIRPVGKPKKTSQTPYPRSIPKVEVCKMVYSLVEKLLSQPYSEAYEGALNFVAAQQESYGVAPLFDTSNPNWAYFRRVANYTHFLLVTLFEICDVSEVARQAVLFYPRPIETIPPDLSVMPDDITPSFPFLLQVACGYRTTASSVPNPCHIIAESIANTAGQLLYSFTYMAAESFVTKEMVDIRTERTKYLCNVVSALLRYHFGYSKMYDDSFEPLISPARAKKLLESVVAILNLALRQNSIQWQLVSPVPFIALTIISSKLPELISDCLGRFDISDPSFEAARADFYKFFRRVSFYDSLDINNDHPMPPGESLLPLEPPSDRDSAISLGERDDVQPIFRTVIEAPHPVDEYESIENDSDFEFDGVEYVYGPSRSGRQRGVNGAPELEHDSNNGSDNDEEVSSEPSSAVGRSGSDGSDFDPESSLNSDQDSSVDNALADEVTSEDEAPLGSQNSTRWGETGHDEDDDDDGFISYENVSDDDAASLASDGTGGSLEANSEMEHEDAEDEEMFSEDFELDEGEDPMEFSLVLEPWDRDISDETEHSSDDDRSYDDSDAHSIYFSDEMENQDTNRAIDVPDNQEDGNSAEQSASLQRASMLAQLYANDVDEEVSDADSFNSSSSIDVVLENEMFNFNSFELELGLGMSGTGRLTNSLGGAGILDLEGELGGEAETPRAFTVHPNSREDFSDMAIYRMDDGEPYYFQFEDIDIDKLLTRNPLLIEPHLLARAANCIFGGELPSVSEKVSLAQPDQLMSSSPTATTFIEFANERTKTRWASYLEYVGLPKREIFARKLRQLFVQVNERDIDVDAEWLESLDDAADTIREIEQDTPSDDNLFREGQDGIYLDEGAEILQSLDSSQNRVPVFGRPEMDRLWPNIKFKFSSNHVWTSSISKQVILAQLRFVFVPWSTQKEAQLICDEVSSLSWDLFHCFVEGLFKILDAVSSGEFGVFEMFMKLDPQNTSPALAMKTLGSTSAELLLRQALLLIVLLQEKPKLRTLLVTVDSDSSLSGGFAVNKLLELLDRPVFRHDSALMERLLFVIDEVTRTICEKVTPNTTGVRGLFSTENLHRLMQVWTADGSTSVAFNHAAHSIAHLGKVISIGPLVSKELLADTEAWIKKMISELDELMSEAESEDGLTSKLTSYTSVQNMLMRASKVAKFKMVPGSYDFALDLFHNRALNLLMNKVSEVLMLAANPHSQFLRISSLKPLIESFLNFGRTASEDKYEHEKSSQGYLRSLRDFISQHFKPFNELVRKNSHQFLSNTVEILKKHSQLLTFENRKQYFSDEMGAFRRYRSRMAVPLKVSRSNLFMDSMDHLMKLEPFELRLGQLDVHFDGEEGIDQGGLNREWYSEMTKYIFHPENGLFEQHPSGLRPKAVPGSLDKFLFIGRFIGKAVVDGQLLDVVFSPSVYKFLLKETMTMEDLKVIDETYYNSLKWMLENDITDVIDEVFAVETPGHPDQLIDLIPNGSKIPVTESNKKEYVELRAAWDLYKRVEPQLEQLSTGFYELMKFSLVSLFNPKELELVIGGIPKIDITDWRLNTEYEGYSASSPQIRWFWRTVKSYDHAQRAKLLQFCTGSAKVPVDGFQHLPAGRFNISRDRRSPEWLPTAHTCTNHLCLPEYTSYDKLRAAVSRAISDGAGSFGLA